jgi:hypothetical protein
MHVSLLAPDALPHIYMLVWLASLLVSRIHEVWNACCVHATASLQLSTITGGGMRGMCSPRSLRTHPLPQPISSLLVVEGFASCSARRMQAHFIGMVTLQAHGASQLAA